MIKFELNQEERNVLSIITVVIGILLLFFTGAGLMIMSRNLLYYVFTPFFYIYIDLVVLATSSFFYAYFLVKPAKGYEEKRISA